MCGIAGLLETDGSPASSAIVKAMTSMLAHRGPDGEGRYTDGPIALGHRRLAVIDPSPAGHQPMTTADQRYALTYNGELFNYQELRAELEALGYSFRSKTDTEVVLLAHAAWGPDAVKRFNGMFAYALWDSEQKVLLLCRDRYGVKPLYYRWLGSTLLFASEAKALLRHPRSEAALDAEALVEYLAFQNILTDRTLLQGVRLLPPGSRLRVPVGRAPVQEQYWDFAFGADPIDASPEECEQEVARLVQQAVSRQLMSDVPLSAYLSGGIDSGAIVAIASAQIPGLRTFTVGFDLSSASGMEIAFDERLAAERLSYVCGTEHYEMVLKGGDMPRVMPRLAWHLEEPRVGQCYPNFYAAQLASKFSKVVLSGVGGDELFGGYPWRYHREPVATLEDLVDSYLPRWRRLMDKGELNAVVGSDGAEQTSREIFRSVLSAAPSASDSEAAVNASLYFEAKTFLHGLLVMEDKISMAHGLENRVPFLDNDLVDFAQRLPAHTKVGPSIPRPINENETSSKPDQIEQRRKDGKRVLRAAMRRHFPPGVTDRDKQGFSAPDASWFRGESMDYVERTLMRPQALIFDFLDRTSVQRAVSEHVSGRRNRRLLIWSLLSLEEFTRTYLAGDVHDGS